MLKELHLRSLTGFEYPSGISKVKCHLKTIFKIWIQRKKTFLTKIWKNKHSANFPLHPCHSLISFYFFWFWLEKAFFKNLLKHPSLVLKGHNRSSHQEMFPGKGVLNICSKFTGEQPSSLGGCFWHNKL